MAAKRPPPELRRTTAALQNGASAYGARYLVPGFAWTPEMDLAFALGWPHLRYLVEGHADGAATGEARTRLLYAPADGLDVPIELAPLRVRGHAGFMCDADGKPRASFYEAIADETPFTAEASRAFIHRFFEKPETMGLVAETVLTLEALVGPDVVLEASAEAIDALSSDLLRAHPDARAQWTRLLGFVLLRALPGTVERARARLTSAHARAYESADVFRGSIATALDAVLFGHAATHLRKVDVEQILVSHDAPASWVRDQVVAREINKWNFSPLPRLVFLGGVELIDYYREHWATLHDAERMRALVALFSEIRSARLWPLMRELAEKSKAKKVAQAWLDAHPEPPADLVARESTGVPEAPVHSGPPPASGLPVLDPDTITAQLDRAFEGNDWPQFFELNPEDRFHGLRLIAARDGARWAVVLERLQGIDESSMVIKRHVYGSEVTGGADLDGDVEIPFSFDDETQRPDQADRAQRIGGVTVSGIHGPLALTDAMVKQYDLGEKKRSRASRFLTMFRAYLAHFSDKGGVWPPVLASLARAKLGPAPLVLIVTDRFEHHDGFENQKDRPRPSRTGTYASLARALAVGDAGHFEPGTPNTDWRTRPVD